MYLCDSSRYIAEARKHEPCIPKELTAFIVEEYVSMRQREKMEAAVANERSVMTARRLLSILRLAQGLARLRWHDVVETDDVEEAIRLVHAASNIDDPNEGKETEKKQDVTSRIYRMICECVRAASGSSSLSLLPLALSAPPREERRQAAANPQPLSLSLSPSLPLAHPPPFSFATKHSLAQVQVSKLEPQVLRKGFSAEQLDRTLTEYEGLEVWTLNASRTRIDFA